MSSTIAGIVVILVVSTWHLRTRRHPNWQANGDARFYISLGYPFLAVAVYFLAGSTRGTDLNWALGNAWALVATVLFVYGFQALGTSSADPAPTGAVEPSRRSRAARSMSRPGTTGS
jgi:hypothetical protein